MNRPASTSSTSESAICIATSALRKRTSPRPPADCADCALMTDAVSVRPAESAGTSPNSTTVASVTTDPKSSTGGFMTIPNPVGNAPPAIAWTSRSVTIATGMASTPPTTASTVDSVSSCATRRPRLAPIDARIAISPAREAPRARSKFATLTHAISSTSSVAPNASVIPSVARTSRYTWPRAPGSSSSLPL